MPVPHTGLHRSAFTLAFTAAAVAAMLSTTVVQSASATSPRSAAPRSANATRTAEASGTSRTLNISMQQQQNSNWCWSASGDTIATYLGYDYTQNQFCDAAFGNPLTVTCPNNEAALDDVQNAFSTIGIDPGRYVTGYLNYSTIQSEINADRPIETRIQWSSGGGHMEVIYGYDTSSGLVYWGDPWPSDYRYNWADYSYYVSNSDFSWTHSLYQIGA